MFDLDLTRCYNKLVGLVYLALVGFKISQRLSISDVSVQRGEDEFVCSVENNCHD